MSLIQEALKRQQAEYGEDGQPPPPVPPPGAAPASAESVAHSDVKPPVQPPDAPDRTAGLAGMPPPSPPVSGGGHPWRSLLGVVVLTVVILGVAAGLIIYAIGHFTGAAPATDTPSRPAVRIADTKAPERAAATLAAAAARAEEVDQLTVPEESPAPDPDPPDAEPQAEISEPQPDTLPVVELAEPVKPAVPTTPPVVAPPAPEPAPEPPPPARVKWPNLRLSGVLRSSMPGEGAARINNTMVFAGGEIEGVKLLRIQEDGVLLGYQGETRFLRVGAILY